MKNPKSKFKLDFKQWSKDWRKEELIASKKTIAYLKNANPKKLKHSYFLRDVIVEYLEYQEITAFELSRRIKDVLKLKYDPWKIVCESIGIWIGPSSVDAYLTPKALLYTLQKKEI